MQLIINKISNNKREKEGKSINEVRYAIWI
jgi:hypothetical protein